MTGGIFHVGVVVRDLDAAQRELAVCGLTWTAAKERDANGGIQRVCWSRQGPPFLELIQGAPDTPWDPVEGSRLDHLAWWSKHFEAELAAFEAHGVPIEIDHRPRGRATVYLRGLATGIRLELADPSHRTTLEREFDVDLA